MTDATATAQPARPFSLARVEGALPWIALGLVGLLLPLLDDAYIGVIAQRACIYWILSAGLNLVVGYAGQIAIGWVAMLTLGAYTTAALTAGNVTTPWHPYLALVAGGATFADVVKLTTYIVGYAPEQRAILNDVRSRYVNGEHPPRGADSGPALPKGHRSWARARARAPERAPAPPVARPPRSERAGPSLLSGPSSAIRPQLPGARRYCHFGNTSRDP